MRLTTLWAVTLKGIRGMISNNLIIGYIVCINIMTCFLFGHDKKKARKERWRIPERTLLFFATMGGAMGAWLGMYLFRHKTKKQKFKVAIPLLLILQIVGFFLFVTRMETGISTVLLSIVSAT